MTTKEEHVEKFEHAEGLYLETKDLSETKDNYLEIINSLKSYGKTLKAKRGGRSESGGVKITWFKTLNHGAGIAYNEFDKLIDNEHYIKFEELKKSVVPTIHKVKSLCQELSFIEPWLIKFSNENYTRMNNYLQQYNSCPFCGYSVYDKTKPVDENFIDYLDRVEEDLGRAVEVLPIMYHHLDNIKITLDLRETV